MKLKYFLRGLGVGILFTVIIFYVFGNKPEKEVLTDEEVMERAKQLGMVMKNQEIEESLNQILNNNQKEAKQEEMKQEEAEQNQVEQNEAEQTEAGQNENRQSEEEVLSDEREQKTLFLPEPLEEEERVIISTITITKGMGSEQTANALKQLGVIENAEEFNDYLCETGNSVKLRVGTYQIEGKPSYEELVKIITKRQ